MNFRALVNLLVAIAVLAGIMVSWEPGPEVRAHAHPYDEAHRQQPPHGVTRSMNLTILFGEPDFEMSGSTRPADLHYHVSADFSTETCSLIRGSSFPAIHMPKGHVRAVDDREPDRVIAESDTPPLI